MQMAQGTKKHKYFGGLNKLPGSWFPVLGNGSSRCAAV